MARFSKEQMKYARRTDLYQFLMRYHGNEFIIEGTSIRPKNNKSISIKNGYSGYKDFSTGETGNSVDYLVRYMGYALTEAVFSLLQVSTVTKTMEPDTLQDEIVKPIFPKPTDQKYGSLFAYLTKRGIERSMIQKLIDSKLLYQSMDTNNLVFINYERDWAELRGTYTMAEKQFHGEVANSRRDGFWWFSTSEHPKVAYICEAAIDAISLYQLRAAQSLKKEAYYISIGGAAKQPAIDRIKKYDIQPILAVDRDEAGERCRARNPELPFILPRLKDWNADLMVVS